MTLHAAVVTASVVRSPKSRALAATTGQVVRITPENHVEISTPAGAVVVAVEEGGLKPGEKVSLQQVNDQVIITRMLETSVGRPGPAALFDEANLRLSGVDIALLLDSAVQRIRDLGVGDDRIEKLLEAIGSLRAVQTPVDAKLARTALALVRFDNEEGLAQKDIVKTLESLLRITGTVRDSGTIAAPGAAKEALIAGVFRTPYAGPEMLCMPNAAKACAWMLRHGAEVRAGEARIAQALGSKPVYVYVTHTAEGASESPERAVVLSGRESIRAELAQFLDKETVSTAIKRCSPDALLGFLASRGSISLTNLREIDTMLLRAEQRVQAAAAPAGAGATASLEQWVGIALDTGAPSFTADAALRSSGDLPAQVRALLADAGESADSLVNGFSIHSAEHLDSRKSELIQSLFQKLGIDFEHRLLHAPEEGLRMIQNRENLKAALLFLLMRTANAGEPNPSVERGDERADRPESTIRPGAVGEVTRTTVHAPEFQAEAPDFTISGMRRQAMAALERLESIQTLARPTRTSEGDQQILALPVCLDGEWTDVRVQLLKRSSGKGSKRDGRFVVNLNVSPSALGEIAARIEYQPSKACIIEVHFEKNEVRSWFERRSEHILEGLANLGLQQAQLLFRRLATAHMSRQRATEAGAGEAVDIII